MNKYVEWRVGSQGDTLVLVDPDRGVSNTLDADADVLKEFLAVPADLEQWQEWSGWREENDQRDPEAFGVLAIRRSEAGDVDFVDPEVFWDGVRRWFRSRGVDYT